MDGDSWLKQEIERLRKEASLPDLAIDYGVALKKNGAEWQGLCPFHNEKTPSFTIFKGKDGIGRFHCFGCDEHGDVVDFVKLLKGVEIREAVEILGGRQAGSNVRSVEVEVRDPYAGIERLTPSRDIQPGVAFRLWNPKRGAGSSTTPSMVFPYWSAPEQRLGYVLRNDLPNGGKETPMVCWVRLPKGTECWSRFPFPRPRPLYIGGGADRLQEGQVVVVEGEKCADAMVRACGRRSVSWAGGTFGVDHADWSPLAGRSVVIWPDADRPGISAAHKIAGRLVLLGCKVKVMQVEEGEAEEDRSTAYKMEEWQSGIPMPKGFDVADAIRDGWTKHDIDTFMRATAEPWTPEPEAERAVGGPSIIKASVSIHNAVRPASELAAEPLASRPVGTDTSSNEAVLRNTKLLPRKDVEGPILDRVDPMPSARALLAERFTSEGVRTMHHYRGTFWKWDGACYRNADINTVNALIWKFLDAARRYNKVTDVIAFQPSKTHVENVLSAFKAVGNLPADIEAPAWLDNLQDRPAPNELLPVQNGLLHLPTGRLLKPSPAFFGHNASGVAFDPHAPAPKEWLAFLRTLWPDDLQAIETLQDIFGYLLSPDTSHQKIPLIIGPKRSGKSTIARILTALLGKESVAAPTLANLSTNFGLAPLIGKSVAIIADARLSGKADQSVIAERLLSISGEDSITIDRKYLDAWTGRLGVRIIIISNELPRLSDASGALASRFLVLTMVNSFYGKEDHELGKRLLAELPGILNWAREGYLRLQERGHFAPSASSEEAVEELEALSSNISAFIKDCCSVEPGLRCQVSELFEAWQDWCRLNGRCECGNVQSFGRDLRAAVPGLSGTRPGTRGFRLRYYEGIGLAGTASPVSSDIW